MMKYCLTVSAVDLRHAFSKHFFICLMRIETNTWFNFILQCLSLFCQTTTLIQSSKPERTFLKTLYVEYSPYVVKNVCMSMLSFFRWYSGPRRCIPERSFEITDVTTAAGCWRSCCKRRRSISRSWRPHCSREHMTWSWSESDTDHQVNTRRRLFLQLRLCLGVSHPTVVFLHRHFTSFHLPHPSRPWAGQAAYWLA